MKKQDIGLTEEWKNDFIQTLREYALKGQYDRALKVTSKALKDYPDEFVCRYQHARILGDWADELPEAQRKKHKRESIRLLKPLLKRLGGKPLLQRNSICINFYYQSEKFKEMHDYGKRFQKTDRRLGLYAQGLGAALLAHKLFDASKLSAAKSWAQKSVKAWTHYDLSKEPYYFAHYANAKALAIAGDMKAARKSLEKAAKVSKRKITDWEFADVLKVIDGKSNNG